MNKELIVVQNPKSPISEIFRTLRTNIQFMDAKKNSKTILVTSAYANEGKSWISSNLAVTFAQAGKKTLLIDADMRKGRQSKIFKVSPRPGISDYLSGFSVNNVNPRTLTSHIQETDVDNLFIISAGSVPPNPSELLISQQMSELLEELKDICDIIVIDGTPCQLVADSLILTRMVDSTIIVAACEETKKEGLKRVINNIENVGGKISGVVLNKVPVMAKEYEQAYYYNREIKNDGVKNARYLSKKEDLLFNNTNREIVKDKNVEQNSEKTSFEMLKELNEYLDNEKKKK